MKCFYNGSFINTSNFNENIEMLITENGLIKYKGLFENDLFNNCSEKIDLKGNTLIPGFNDSHMHLLVIKILKYFLEKVGRKIISLKKEC